MRLRLMIVMLVVVGITIASVVGFAMISTQREVNTYIFRGGMYGLNDLVTRLEDYYQQNKSWDSVQNYFAYTHGTGGMMGNQDNGMGMLGSGDQQGNSNRGNGTPRNNIVPEGVSHLVLVDASGKTITSFRGQPDIQQLTEDQLKSAIPLRDSDGNKVVGYLYTDETAPIQPGRETPLTQKLYDSVQKGAIIGIVIAVVASLLLGYWYLKPIRELTDAASALGEGDLNQRVPASGKDELGQLGKTFNTMATSLQRAEESRKSMTADIAHELRTPLAVQRATLEAMVDGVYPMDEESLKPVMEQNLLLTHLVDDLRTLALADAGELSLEKVETNLATLSKSVFRRFQSQADSQQVRLEFQLIGEPPTVGVDPIRMEQIITNLMGNALRFTPADGMVKLEISSQDDTVFIRVQDTGPGIPEDALPFIFERFYRADKSRNRGEGGSGLGLAIARQLARAHNGDLTASNRENGGAEFCLSLPTHTV